MLTASLILAIMVLPFITIDLARRIRCRSPRAPGGVRPYMGARPGRVVALVVLPFTRVGVMAA